LSYVLRCQSKATPARPSGGHKEDGFPEDLNRPTHFASPLAQASPYYVPALVGQQGNIRGRQGAPGTLCRRIVVLTRISTDRSCYLGTKRDAHFIYTQLRDSLDIPCTLSTGPPHLDFDQDHQHSLGVGTIALFRDLRTRLTFHLRHNQLQTSESVTVCIRFLPIDCVVRPHLNCCGLRLHQEYLLTLAAKTSNGPLDRQTIRSLSHDSVWPTGSSNIRASILFYSCQPNLRAAGIQEILLSENKRGAADYLFRPRFLRPLTSHASG
jgi:hypothetical protein